MLTISKRDAKLGRNGTIRTEDHGDEPVKALDFRLTGVHLDAGELNALTQDPGMHARLFMAPSAENLPAKAAPSKLLEPTLKRFEPLRLIQRIESARVTVHTPSGEEIGLGICRLKSITLEPKTGGATELSCLVQSKPDLDERISGLIYAMADAIQVEVSYEHNAEQGELAVSSDKPGNGDEDDDDEDEKPAKGKGRGRGRAPRDQGDRAH